MLHIIFSFVTLNANKFIDLSDRYYYELYYPDQHTNFDCYIDNFSTVVVSGFHQVSLRTGKLIEISNRNFYSFPRCIFHIS